MSAPKFSLSFTKKIEKKTLQPSAIRNDAPREAETKTENIESIEENVLKTDGKAQVEELVIPLIQLDRAEIFRKLAEKSEKHEADKLSEGKEKVKNQEEAKDDQVQAKPLTLDEQAEVALLEESKKKLDTWTERGAPNSLTIQVDQKDSTGDSELYAVGKESSIDNYDEVNVEHFGAALLRGMGWQKKEGIGKRNKKVVDIIDPSAKTFGLIGRLPGEKGIGETKSAAGEEELTLQKGSFVFIHSGRQRGTYGVVESLDEDHILVKAAVSQGILREVELNVRVVSQKEFKDSSRVINKEMYDKYKEKEKKEKEQKKKSKYSDDSDDNDNRDKRKSKKDELKKPLKEEALKKTLKDEELKKTLKDEELKKTLKEEDNSCSADDKLKLRRNAESTVNRNKYKEESDKGSRESDNRDEKYRDEDTEKRRYKENYEKGSKYQKNSERDNRYKESENRGSRQREEGEGKSRYTENRRKDDYSSKSNYKRYQSDSSKYVTEPADHGSGQKRSKSDDYKQDMKKFKSYSEKMPAVPWVRENLRVRLINKDYKGGKYHKEKVIVRNVVTAECCECMTTEGDILRKVHPEWLETVIPKIPPQIIMIVKGKQKGQRGQILQLHKEQEKASVQLLEDETVIMKLHYDDICEYV